MDIKSISWDIVNLVQEQINMVLLVRVCALVILAWFALYLVPRIIMRLVYLAGDLLRPLPMTDFGFKGRLVYVDDGSRKPVFVSHKYELSSKPDFIFYIGRGQYAPVEFKSSKTIHPEHEAQLCVEVLTARTKYNIKKGYIVAKNEKKEYDFSMSSRSIYRQIRSIHRRARLIKLGKIVPAIERCRSQRCYSCAHRDNCAKG